MWELNSGPEPTTVDEMSARLKVQDEVLNKGIELCGEENVEDVREYYKNNFPMSSFESEMGHDHESGLDSDLSSGFESTPV